MAGRTTGEGGVRERTAGADHRGSRGRWLLVAYAMIILGVWIAARFVYPCDSSGLIW